MANVLVFDECQVSRALIKRLLTNNGGWTMNHVSSVENAIQCLEQVPVDVVISDFGGKYCQGNVCRVLPVADGHDSRSDGWLFRRT